MSVFAAIKKAEGPIPELRPPKGEIAFDIPEGAILNAALIFAFVVLLVGRFIHMRRPAPPLPIEPPIHVARRELEAVSGPSALEECARIVRRYVLDAYGLGPEGATAAELAAQFAAHRFAITDLTIALETFLADCDRARFAPEDAEHLAETCTGRALALVEALDQRRRTAEPAPLPVAT
ncbi:MAG: hypothetical protein ABMA13_13345 [Chthoniobacteraceae bacterium]